MVFAPCADIDSSVRLDCRCRASLEIEGVFRRVEWVSGIHVAGAELVVGSLSPLCWCYMMLMGAMAWSTPSFQAFSRTSFTAAPSSLDLRAIWTRLHGQIG